MDVGNFQPPQDAPGPARGRSGPSLNRPFSVSCAQCSWPRPPWPSVTSGPSWCERGPVFSGWCGWTVCVLPVRRQTRGVCVFMCISGSVCAPRIFSVTRQAAQVRLPEEGPEGEVRKWKAAEFSPGLRCKREAGSLRSARPGKVRSVPHPPVWPTALSSTRDRWGRFPVWLCSGPRMDAWHRPAAWLSSRRTGLKGRAEHRVPFPGSPYGEKRSAKQVCQAQTQMEPHWSELWELLLPGSHS